MKNNLKRTLSLLMTLALCLGAFSVLAVNVFADETAEGLKKGEFVFAPHTVLNEDLPDYYYYSDHFFDGSALEYNEHLATMSMILCAASISSQDPDADYEDKSRNLENLMLDLDFWGFKVNDYYRMEPEEQTMGVAMAFRTIGEGENAYTVLAIVPRSAGYQKEWAGNFTVGTEGVHQGFATGRDIILEYAKEYVAYHADDFEEEVKIWTMGYSRGAGVTNLVAAALVQDSKEAIGLEVKQENIFAYTFGTPSTVEYTTEAEKAALANDYANIWNVHSDYDIVTLAPFRNWGFTYYGKHYEMDVYNAEKKAVMLEFLKETNPTVHELYTEENSAADPDNFAAVMLSLGEEGIGFAPAKSAYGIPTNQKDFLESRIQYLVDHLVPDRETYVDEGYQYALQQVTSLYFGLDADGSGALIDGMSANAIPLVASYYCYYVSDAFVNEENIVTMAAVLKGTIAYLEQYLAAAIQQNPELTEQEWYVMLDTVMKSDEYVTLKQMLATTSPEALKGYVPMIKAAAESFAVQMTANALAGGIDALGIEDETEYRELIGTLTDEKVTRPLTKFIVYLLLGHEDASAMTAFDPENKSVAIAATFIYNSGRYMRVHNNEILLSWLRAEDSYYLDPPHIHHFVMYQDENNHGYVCECGLKKGEEAHSFGEWVITKEATKDEVGTREKRCGCGYSIYEEIPVLKNTTKTVLIILGSTLGVLVVAAGIATPIIVKKRRRSL